MGRPGRQIVRGATCAALALLAGLGCAVAGEPLLILAGTASRPVLERAVPLLRSDLGIEIELSFGGSGQVLAQLELARRGDVFLPGSHDYVDRAAARGLVVPGSRVDLALLTPALLVPRGNPAGITGLADLRRPGVRSAIGDPRSVCVGQYAVDVLARAGLERELLPRLGRASSCEALANLLVLGSVDAIIGWDVFARWHGDRIEVVPLPPELLTASATVQGAVVASSRRQVDAARVLAWLAGPRGRALWEAEGYRVPAMSPALAAGR